MQVIYQPKGRAHEYSELACNLEKLTDWKKFLKDVKKLLTKVQADYYIKQDLQRFE